MTDAVEVAVARARRPSLWPRQEADWYVEPLSVWQRFFEAPSARDIQRVMDPCCGRGTVLHAALEKDLEIAGGDLAARWEDDPQGAAIAPHCMVRNFLTAPWPYRAAPAFQFPDAIISNPPFKAAQAVVQTALARTQRHVVMLLPAVWLNAARRVEWLQGTPLYRVYLVSPRPSMPPGHVILRGEKPGNGTQDYAVVHWLLGYHGRPTLDWLRR